MAFDTTTVAVSCNNDGDDNDNGVSSCEGVGYGNFDEDKGSGGDLEDVEIVMSLI